MSYHLTIGEETWCSWSSCQAGADILRQIPARARSSVWCGHRSRETAEQAAEALAPFFKPGRVRVQAGECPHFSGEKPR